MFPIQDDQDQDDQDPDLDLNPDACTSKVKVTADWSTIWNASMNFSQAWSKAEQKAKTPAHHYMRKQHSVAIYMYTQAVRQPGGTVLTAGEGPEKQLTSESQPLFTYLSEAIQILKHSQRLCHTTSYPSDPSSNLSMSGKLLRFGTFVLGSDGCRRRGNTCFQVHTCFGVDISHYSALEEDGQVLIPPYEVFKVTHVTSDARGGEFTHKLESNLNCVYDRASGSLHPISIISNESWLMFGITFMVIVLLFLPFVIFKVLKKWELKIFNWYGLYNGRLRGPVWCSDAKDI